MLTIRSMIFEHGLPRCLYAAAVRFPTLRFCCRLPFYIANAVSMTRTKPEERVVLLNNATRLRKFKA